MPEPRIDLEEVFRLRAEGATHAQIAARFGVHRSTIGRILAAGEPAKLPTGGCCQEVERIAAALGDNPSASERAKLALLRVQAAKLDQLQTQGTANSGVAIGNLSPRYNELVDALTEQAEGVFVQIRNLLIADSDSAAEYFRGVLTVIAEGGMSHPKATQLTAEELRAIARKALDKGGY